MPPAVAASDARSPVPSSLIGRLKMISARTSDSSSGGVLESASAGFFSVPVIRTLRLDAGVGDLARRGHVEHRVELGVAGEPQRAVPGEIELAALELIRAAHGVDGAGERDRTTGVLADVQIAAERDVEVADRGSRRTARPQLPAPRRRGCRESARARRARRSRTALGRRVAALDRASCRLGRRGAP